MDQFNTPWRVTSAAIYTTPTDSRVTPAIIRDAHARSVSSIADEIRDKASNGRSGVEITALGLSAHSFGSFVVSDIGSFGLNTGMTALMPAAKVPAVIVLGKVEEKPVIRGGEIVIRTILPLTGTFDHRIVDGMQIGKLARGIKRNFRKPECLDEKPEKELENCLFQPRD
jgi:pyruvate/2-oxoglutarate dehydrogenase complex dihydrolipoamide acyltransferase (E2) component